MIPSRTPPLGPMSDEQAFFSKENLDTARTYWKTLGQELSPFNERYKQFKEPPSWLIKSIAKKESKLMGTYKESNYAIIPLLIITGRYTPQNAAYLLHRWLEYVEKKIDEVSSLQQNEAHMTLFLSKRQLIQKLKKVLVWRTTCEGGEDGLAQALKRKDQKPYYSPSGMKETFKPLIGLPKIKLEVVNKILGEAGQPEVKEGDLKSIVDYYALLNQLEGLCGVTETSVVFTRYRKRKFKSNYMLEQKDTETAVYKGLNHKERMEKLHKSLWHFRKYNRALMVAGKLRGRLSTCFQPYITGLCARVDKSGMATQLFTPEYFTLGDKGQALIQQDSKVDIPTVVFMCLAVSEFSVRKAFTIESQMHGGLDTALSYLLSLMTNREKETRWELVASLYPVEDVVSHLSHDEKSTLLAQYLSIQIPMAKFLEDQWKRGVDRCTKKNMMVPSGGSTNINTTGWNATAGAWNRSLGLIRAISKSIGKQPPVLIKCMRLTAADQMRWAARSGKDAPEDVPVFKKLTLELGITPWGIVLGHVGVTSEDIAKVCKGLHVDPKRWLGYVQERTTTSRIHGDMICGCAVPNDAAVQSILKSLGAFGYKPSHSSE